MELVPGSSRVRCNLCGNAKPQALRHLLAEDVLFRRECSAHSVNCSFGMIWYSFHGRVGQRATRKNSVTTSDEVFRSGAWSGAALRFMTGSPPKIEQASLTTLQAIGAP